MLFTAARRRWRPWRPPPLFAVSLCETLGGLSPAFCNLLKEAAEARSNRLTSGEYDATTWAARTWLSYTVQKISVALHRAVALEIAESLGFATAVDARA